MTSPGDAEKDGSVAMGDHERGGPLRAIRGNWAGLVVFAVAAGMRLWLAGHAVFGYEESMFYEEARELASGHRFPALGPPVTGGEARHPGGLFYVIVAASQLARATPEAAYAWVALLGAASVWLFWAALRRAGFGGWGAGLAGLLMAVSPWSVFYADRVWNSNVVGILVAPAFWAAVVVRQEPRSRWVALLVFCAAVMPQVHLSAPVVWVALAVMMGRWQINWRWALVGVAGAAIAYGPYLASEWSTGFANARAFFKENAGKPRFPLAVPAYMIRFATLDVAYFEMSAHSLPIHEEDLIAASVMGDRSRPFHPLRAAALAASVVLAVAALVASRRNPPWKPFGRALLAGFVASLALIGWSGKVVFPHYIQPLLPFVFAIFASLPRRWWVAVLSLAFALGAMDAVAMVAWHMDDKNGLPVHRRVIDRLRREPGDEVQLSFDFQGSPFSYQILSKYDDGRPRFGKAGPVYVLIETDGKRAPPVAEAEIETLGRVRLRAIETIGPVTLYRAGR